MTIFAQLLLTCIAIGLGFALGWRWCKHSVHREMREAAQRALNGEDRYYR